MEFSKLVSGWGILSWDAQKVTDTYNGRKLKRTKMVTSMAEYIRIIWENKDIKRKRKGNLGRWQTAGTGKKEVVRTVGFIRHKEKGTPAVRQISSSSCYFSYCSCTWRDFIRMLMFTKFSMFDVTILASSSRSVHVLKCYLSFAFSQ